MNIRAYVYIIRIYIIPFSQSVKLQMYKTKVGSLCCNIWHQSDNYDMLYHFSCGFAH